MSSINQNFYFLNFSKELIESKMLLFFDRELNFISNLFQNVLNPCEKSSINDEFILDVLTFIMFLSKSLVVITVVKLFSRIKTLFVFFELLKKSFFLLIFVILILNCSTAILFSSSFLVFS